MTPKDKDDDVNSEEIYAGLRQKHPELPEYAAINNEFELSLIEQEDFFLRAVIKRMAERLEGFARMIEEIVHGDSTLSNLHEWKNFDEKLKKSVLGTYRTIMLTMRTALESSLDHDEGQDAKTVKLIWDNWQKAKPELKSFVSEMKKSWESDIDMADNLEYLG